MKLTMNQAEAEELLNVSETSLMALVRAGEIPAAKISMSWVFMTEDLLKYLRTQVKEQTAIRKEATSSGKVAKIKPAASEARSMKRRSLPVLEQLPQAA